MTLSDQQYMDILHKIAVLEKEVKEIREMNTVVVIDGPNGPAMQQKQYFPEIGGPIYAMDTELIEQLDVGPTIGTEMRIEE